MKAQIDFHRKEGNNTLADLFTLGLMHEVNEIKRIYRNMEGKKTKIQIILLLGALVVTTTVLAVLIQIR
jgi:hypothetical protein